MKKEENNRKNKVLRRINIIFSIVSVAILVYGIYDITRFAAEYRKGTYLVAVSLSSYVTIEIIALSALFLVVLAVFLLLKRFIKNKLK